MNNPNNTDKNNNCDNCDCEITPADVAREVIFPKKKHFGPKEQKSECGSDCNCNCVNEHLRRDDSSCGKDCDCKSEKQNGYTASASPSEPADSAYMGRSLLECGVDVFAESKTDGQTRTRPTNPNYKMIDPGDDSADTSKS